MITYVVIRNFSKEPNEKSLNIHAGLDFSKKLNAFSLLLNRPLLSFFTKNCYYTQFFTSYICLLLNRLKKFKLLLVPFCAFTVCVCVCSVKNLLMQTYFFDYPLNLLFFRNGFGPFSTFFIFFSFARFHSNKEIWFIQLNDLVLRRYIGYVCIYDSVRKYVHFS